MRQKITVATFTSALAVLLMASAAWACTTLMGTSTVTGTSGSSTVTGSGSGSMVYCSGNAGTGNASASSGNSISVSVAPATCSGTSYQLDSGNNSMMINNVAAFTRTSSTASWGFVSGKGCWAGGQSPSNLTPSTQAVTTGGVFTNGNAQGFVSETLPSGLAANNTNEASVICVGNSTHGMLVPIIIT